MTPANDLDRYRDEFAPQPARADNDKGEHVAASHGVHAVRSPSSGCRSCLTGCGCAVIAFFLVVIALGVFVAYSWRWVAASVCRQVANQAIAAAPLPEADRQRITQRVDRMADDFAAGRITLEQLGRIVEEMTKGPLFALALIHAADLKYVQPSGLAPAEKRAARRTLERLARSLVEQKLRVQDTEALLKPIVTIDDDKDVTLKEIVTDAELREFLAGAKKKVDDLGIPDEPFALNVADAVDEAIDRALGNHGRAER